MRFLDERLFRNTKPDNVMLVPDEEGGTQVKLLDFGVAKNLSLGQGAMTTVSGALLGTPAYMAPEQIKHSANVDGRADLYAIGVMLYEALVGERPFSGNAIELLSAQLFEQVPPASAMAAQKGVVRPQINWPQMDRIVGKALSKEPASRYAQVAEFLVELQAAWPRVTLPDVSGKAHAASTASSGTSIPEDHQTASAKLRWRWLAGALLTVVALGLTWRLFRPAPSPAQKGPSTDRTSIPLSKPVDSRELARQRIGKASHGSREDRRALALAIAEVGGSAHSTELRALLLDAEPSVARVALQAVTSCGGKGDVELLSALREMSTRAGGSLGVEVMAARLLLGDASVQAALQGAASSGVMDAETRLRASIALSQAGLLKSAALRGLVLQAVKQTGVRPGPYRQALVELLRVGDAETTKRLTKALGDSNLRLRSEAAEVLARAGRPDGQESLWQLAKANPTEMSYPMLLAQSGDARARTLLLARLGDPSAVIRQQAVVGLGTLAARGIRPCEPATVVQLLSDADSQVSISAAVSFVALERCALSKATAAP